MIERTRQISQLIATLDRHPVVEIPLLPDEPTDLKSLEELGGLFESRLDEALETI